MAKNSGVNPPGVGRSICAPAPISALIAATLPDAAAHISGVCPRASGTSGLAPIAIMRVTVEAGANRAQTASGEI
jgi:hypothetical protein